MSMLRHRFSNERWGPPLTTFLPYSVKVFITVQSFIVLASLVFELAGGGGGGGLKCPSLP